MACVKLRENENIETLLKRFKKAVINDGVLEEYRKREYYVAPSLKKRLKSENAQKRNRKLQHTTFKKIDSGYDY